MRLCFFLLYIVCPTDILSSRRALIMGRVSLVLDFVCFAGDTVRNVNFPLSTQNTVQ